ncbi:DUF1207 domain-containing protein [Chlamydiifrater volucris]|uniref:DUF1207 domain-containing protein n=1 Tax=Chlamydiifrater volucris TaxID=2681470 RepID=UPI001BCECA68|nr:DUF1207 domain-containing protein [Chlamydiifrater volucris]
MKRLPFYCILALGLCSFSRGVAGFCQEKSFLTDSFAEALESECFERKECPECRLDNVEIVRTDQIPERLELCPNDRYVTGYVQALLDMHYVDCRVRTVVLSGKAYLFSLPNDDCLATDIVCFVQDIPCINSVEAVSCHYEDFLRENCPVSVEGKIVDITLLENSNKNPLPACRSVRSPILFGKEGVWLPQNTVLFQPLVADPRQVTTSASIRFDDKVIGSRVGSAVFGGDIILLRLFDVGCLRGDLDLGIQCGVFSVFDLEHPDACMVNSDFFVGLLFGYAFDKWSCRLRMWHLSSHLGDEFLLTHPNFPRFNLSDEGIDFFLSYTHNHALRLYGGVGYIVNRDLTFPEKPLYFECGSEIRPFGLRDRENNLYAQPIMAMHFRFWEEQDFGLDQTYVVGMEWSRFRDVGRKIRALLEYHEGFSKEGQFIREPSRYYGFRLMYGL